MSLWALAVRVAPGRRDALAEWLVGRTGQAVVERGDGAVVGYVEGPSLEALVREVAEREGAEATIEREQVVPVDWVTRWREGLGPRRVGRILLAPSWSDTVAAPGEVRLTLDPGAAFGSGEHGSTRGALALLDRHLAPGARLLDLGSGSGILAIAAVLLGASRAIGIELDADAIPVAQANAERNGVAGRIVFLHGDAGRSAPLGAPADIVCSNILRTINVSLLPAIRAALAPGGVAIFAGMEEAEEGLFRPALEAERFAVVDEVRDEGWWSVSGRLR